MPPVAVHETHISYVFLVGEHAAKLKKPVRFPFLDWSTREQREAACHREVELNRRLAPDVYLGVYDVVGPDGTPADHVVLMRRMPDDRRLSHLVSTRAIDGASLVPVARVLAAFHARAERSPRIDAAGRRDAVRARWASGFTEIADLLDGDEARATEEEIERLVVRYLDGRRPLFDARIAAGMVVDGHGDLLADDVFLLPDGPRVLDCLEFDDELRFGDVLADVTFLAMDLERLGAARLAHEFLRAYREMSAEQHPVSLEHHYVALRAHVRAKVAYLRGGDADRVEARGLLDLARAHLRRGRVGLVLVGGEPATGKSTLAQGLGDRLGWPVLRSDEIRKDLAGVGHAVHMTAAPGAELYDRAHTDATYAELLGRARRLLELGESVVLDATWSEAGHRHDAARLADETSSDLVSLRCEVPVEEAVARARRRFTGPDPSDATEPVIRDLAGRFAPWPEATVVSSRGTPAETLAAALPTFATWSDGPGRPPSGS